ncbi:MAG TPA: hypothetical protein PLR25_13670 [Planctomycetaceae bacterium]|nr:hypothetical protein [Planctomycetaceae bacterium]
MTVLKILMYQLFHSSDDGSSHGAFVVQRAMHQLPLIVNAFGFGIHFLRQIPSRFRHFGYTHWKLTGLPPGDIWQMQWHHCIATDGLPGLEL